MFLFVFSEEFTEAQKSKIEDLKSTKEVIDVYLTKYGITVVITNNEPQKMIVPQGDRSKAYYLPDKRRTYFIKEDGSSMGDPAYGVYKEVENNGEV